MQACIDPAASLAPWGAAALHSAAAPSRAATGAALVSQGANPELCRRVHLQALCGPVSPSKAGSKRRGGEGGNFLSLSIHFLLGNVNFHEEINCH